MKPRIPEIELPSIGSRWSRLSCGVLLGAALCLPALCHGQCVGDCDADDVVGIRELIQCVRVALGDASEQECPPCDEDRDGAVTVNELILAVGLALTGCPQDPTPTATPTSGPNSNSCPYAFDGECDEPGIGTGACLAGTDTADCR